MTTMSIINTNNNDDDITTIWDVKYSWLEQWKNRDCNILTGDWEYMKTWKKKQVFMGNNIQNKVENEDEGFWKSTWQLMLTNPYP